MIKDLAAEVQERCRKEEEEKNGTQNHSSNEQSEEQMFKCLSSDTLEFRNEVMF